MTGKEVGGGEGVVVERGMEGDFRRDPETLPWGTPTFGHQREEIEKDQPVGYRETRSVVFGNQGLGLLIRLNCIPETC